MMPPVFVRHDGIHTIRYKKNSGGRSKSFDYSARDRTRDTCETPSTPATYDGMNRNADPIPPNTLLDMIPAEN